VRHRKITHLDLGVGHRHGSAKAGDFALLFDIDGDHASDLVAAPGA
jgi:hypothetical protein